jgi:hypothetical protein
VERKVLLSAKTVRKGYWTNEVKNISRMFHSHGNFLVMQQSEFNKKEK